MSFQDKINSVMRDTLKGYEKEYKYLKVRADMKAMDLKFEQTQKQAEKEEMGI